MVCSQLRKNNSVGHIVLSFDEQRRLANQYLNRITLLQEELSMEEEKLIQLLRRYGLGIFSC